MSYLQLGLALTVAGVGIGIGIGMVFPTVANAVLATVPPAEARVVSGTNSTMRELGGVLGKIAVLAAVFARHGVYGSHHLLVDGFRPALWVAVGISALGAIVAALSRGRVRAPTPRSAPKQRIRVERA